MKNRVIIAGVLMAACALTTVAGERRISVEEYRDKMAGGWIGQMVGVGWGAPTEYRAKGEIMPEDMVPVWKPKMVNQYRQDDLYVEMTFLRSMEQYGLDVSIRQAGIDFANSSYGLAHANKWGRDNLRKGIAPPDSGHPQFTAHADDIDYQIEADYAGLISPGMPNMGIELGEKFGRMMSYGEGLYGGQFVAGMYAAAFFESDPRKMVEAGLACVPAGSQFAETIRDVIQWHAEAPNDWQAVWEKIDAKYSRNKDYRRFTCPNDPDPVFNIDAKYNAAFIVMGLLYGEGDIAKTTVISMRCGADSDCNPSSAAGILCTAIGMRNLPSQYVSALDRTTKFNHTAYDFDSLLAVCEKITRQTVVQQGGRIENDVFVIPVRAPKPTALEQCWEAGPIANSRFTEEEMKKINQPPEADKKKGSAPKKDISKDVAAFAPGWKIRDCDSYMRPGLREEWGGRKNVLATRTIKRGNVPCVLSRSVDIPSGKKTTLELTVRNEEQCGRWKLIARVDGKEILAKMIDADKWQEFSADLSAYAGKTIDIELLNQATGWKPAFEGAYWANIEIRGR